MKDSFETEQHTREPRYTVVHQSGSDKRRNSNVQHVRSEGEIDD